MSINFGSLNLIDGIASMKIVDLKSTRFVDQTSTRIVDLKSTRFVDQISTRFVDLKSTRIVDQISTRFVDLKSTRNVKWGLDFGYLFLEMV